MSQSVYDKARQGGYKSRLLYPDRAKEPAVFRKSVKDLTPDEIASLDQVKAEYAAAIEAYNAAHKAYNADEARLINLLKSDLEAEHGLTGHPKADKLWSKAWEQGHSSGYAEVALAYEDLAELVK